MEPRGANGDPHRRIRPRRRPGVGPEDRRDWWERLITRAEIGSPRDFAIRNGRASQLVQTVWSAVIDGEPGFERTLRTVIAAGGDTATAGAIAGGILGARWGMSAIPWNGAAGSTAGRGSGTRS